MAAIQFELDEVSAPPAAVAGDRLKGVRWLTLPESGTVACGLPRAAVLVRLLPDVLLLANHPREFIQGSNVMNRVTTLTLSAVLLPLLGAAV